MFSEIERSQRWKLPDTCADERIRRLSIAVENQLFLDLSTKKNQAFLFQEFCKLRSLDDSKIWYQNVGILYPSVTTHSDILSLSKTVQWAWKFFRELRDGNTKFFRSHIRVTSLLQRRLSKYTEEEEFKGIEERVLTAFEAQHRKPPKKSDR